MKILFLIVKLLLIFVIITPIILAAQCDTRNKQSQCYIDCCNDIKTGSDRLNLFWSQDYIKDTCDSYCIPRCLNKELKLNK